MSNKLSEAGLAEMCEKFERDAHFSVGLKDSHYWSI